MRRQTTNHLVEAVLASALEQADGWTGPVVRVDELPDDEVRRLGGTPRSELGSESLSRCANRSCADWIRAPRGSLCTPCVNAGAVPQADGDASPLAPASAPHQAPAPRTRRRRAARR